jgi:hypothetical protein
MDRVKSTDIALLTKLNTAAEAYNLDPLKMDFHLKSLGFPGNDEKVMLISHSNYSDEFNKFLLAVGFQNAKEGYSIEGTHAEIGAALDRVIENAPSRRIR